MAHIPSDCIHSFNMPGSPGLVGILQVPFGEKATSVIADVWVAVGI